MAYIGFNPSQLAVAPFATKYFTGDGTTTTFTLDQSVPGANEANIEVFVENVQQNPIDAYTIGGALNNQLIFSEPPVVGGAIYVIHKGEATYNLQPATGSVTANTLDPVLRNFTVDNFTGNGSTKTFTLTAEALSPNSILVVVDGITQTAGVNYNVSGTTLTFDVAPTAAPDNGSNITVIHLGFASGNKAVMDRSITPVKLSTGGPTWDTSSNLSVTGRLGLGGTYANYKLGVNGNAYIGPVSATKATTKAELTNNAVLTLKPHTTDSTNMNIGTVGTGDVMGIQVTNGGATANWHVGLNPFGGNVIIGSSSTPNWLLHLKSQYPYICFEDTDSATGIQATITANQDGNMYYDANINNTATPGGHIWRANGGGIMMMLEQTGSALGRLNLSYGQIKFPASQNASSDPNTLDDYEEGTHQTTVTIGSGTLTYVSRNLQYVKIGRQVTIWGRLHVNLSATNVTSFRFTLPFALAFGNGSSDETEVATVAQVIRATANTGVSGAGPDGIRIFRGISSTSQMTMQTADGGETGNFGVTNPHINFAFSYYTTA